MGAPFWALSENVPWHILYLFKGNFSNREK